MATATRPRSKRSTKPQAPRNEPDVITLYQVFEKEDETYEPPTVPESIFTSRRSAQRFVRDSTDFKVAALRVRFPGNLFYVVEMTLEESFEPEHSLDLPEGRSAFELQGEVTTFKSRTEAIISAMIANNIVIEEADGAGVEDWTFVLEPCEIAQQSSFHDINQKEVFGIYTETIRRVFRVVVPTIAEIDRYAKGGAK